MLKTAKITAWIGVVLLFVMFINESACASSIDIFINGEKQTYRTDPVIDQGHTLVPLRGLFEDLGADVDWNADERSVSASNDRVEMKLWIDETTARLNGEIMTLSVPAQIIDGRTMVPIRMVAETFGAEVEWDEVTTTIHMKTNQHKVPTFSLEHLPMGEPFSEWVRQFGESERKTLSPYGFTWHAYHHGYDNYYQIGVDNGKVVAFHTNFDLFAEGSLLSVGMKKDEVEKALGEPITYIKKGNLRFNYATKDEWSLFEYDESFVTVFYDTHSDYLVSAIRVIDKEVEEGLQDFYGPPSEALRQDYERQFFDLANATRVKHGLDPLEWYEPVREVARGHSDDMVENQYFSHENQEGQTPFDRLKAADIHYQSAGENLAVRQLSPIFAQEDLYNSESHRRNLLYERYTHAGTGVSFLDSKPYYVQMFLSPM